MTNKKYDWKEIQEYYDLGNSWRDLYKKFGVSFSALDKARKRGDFISRERVESIRFKDKMHGRKPLTEKHKKNLSIARKKYLNENPDKVPYLLNHNSKGISYPEQYFKDGFKNENIQLTHHHRIGLYELDFCDVDKKINIEIDGEQHYVDQRIIESDERRTKFLEDLGWTVIRIRWSEYMKMNFEEKEKVFIDIKKMLKE